MPLLSAFAIPIRFRFEPSIREGASLVNDSRHRSGEGLVIEGES